VRFPRAAILSLGLATFLAAAPARGADREENDTESPAQSPLRPYLRVVLGELTFLGVQAAWYWGHQEPSESELPFTLSTWRQKLFSVRYFVFDDDHFNTNAVGHPVAGVFYYQIARGNGLGVGASFLTTVAASTAWKYFGEANQKLSTNDLIVTPAAGWVLGEAIFRIGRLFADGAPSLENCIGAVLFSPVASLNETPVCHNRWRRPPFTEMGFSTRTWYRLYAELGTARAVIDGDTARDETAFGFGARITTHALYRQPGAGTSNAGPGQWTSIDARWLIDNGAIDGVATHADSLVLGRYYRNYADVAGESGEPDGLGLLLGVGSSFDYDGRSLPTLYDRTLALGLLGPMIELAVRHGRLALRATLAASYSFAQVTSLAWAEAAPEFANVYVKSVLQIQGYYFGQGLLTFAGLEAELGDVRLRLDGRSQSIWSFNRDDNHQGQIQNNFSLHDTQTFLTATAAWQPFSAPARLTLELDDIIRDSSLPGTVVTSTEHRIIGAVVLLL
jgi:Domain of unknown function (DUF3943)